MNNQNRPTRSDDPREPLLAQRRGSYLSGSPRIVYTCFLILGLGALLPWNFFITAESYWQYKFRNTTLNGTYSFSVSNDDEDVETRTNLQQLYTPLLVCLSQITNFCFLIFNAIFAHRWHLKKRLVFTLTAMSTIFLGTTILVLVDTDGWQLGFFILTMSMVVMLNCCGALFQGGLFGLAGMFPPQYMTSLLTGQALGGIFASAARIVSLALGANDVKAAFYFFVIAMFVMGLTLASLIYLFQTDLYRLHAKGSATISTNEDDTSFDTKSFIMDTVRVLKEIWPLSLSVFMVFFVTLSLFPAVVVHTTSNSTNIKWKEVYFQPVMTFLVYNIFDCVGRRLAGHMVWPSNGPQLYFLVGLRLVFIPLMMLCNHTSVSSYIPSLFMSDWTYGFLMILLGLSSGYITTLCMTYGPEAVKDRNDAERAGWIMAASLGGGLLGGGIVSFGFEALYY